MELVFSPNDFADGTQTERIQKAIAALKANGGGTVELGVDTVSVPETNIWTITESIRLPSHTTLFLNHCKLKLADGVFDTIIRNEGIIVDQDNPNGLAQELRCDCDIKIIGSGVGSAFIEGPDHPYSAPHPIDGGPAIPWIGDFYGWRTVSIRIRNIKASSTCHVIICLAAGGAKVRNIFATDIEDDMRLSAVNIVSVYTGYGESAKMGDISDIHMKRIVSNNSSVALKINTPLLDCSFEGVEQRKEGAVAYEITPPYDTKMKNVRIS